MGHRDQQEHQLKRVLAFAVFYIVLATAGFAKPVLYDCAFPKDVGGGWIAPQIVASYDAETGTAKISDGVILHYLGQPIDGKVRVLTDGKIEFRWDLQNLQNSGQNLPIFEYRLRFNPSNNKARIDATPVGYSNKYQSSGVCKKS